MSLVYNYLNIGVWNIQGLFQSINKYKICKLDDESVRKRIKRFDILCLQETLCGPCDTQNLNFKGYKLIPLHRKVSKNNRYYGGSLLLIKSNIRAGIKILDQRRGDKIWIKLCKDYFGLQKDLYTCFAYINPKNSPYILSADTDPFQEIEMEVMNYNNSGNILLAGDMNAKTCKAKDYLNDVGDNNSPMSEVSTYVRDIPHTLSFFYKKLSEHLG